MSGYDVIGDVHGQLDKLHGLLHRLGYRRPHGTWHHADGRQAVFVGDVIDRGTPQRATVELVRSMIDDGVALITMGNHEWNAISFATPHPEEPGEYLRHRRDHHQLQHEQFLDDYVVDSADHASVIAWFRTIPMWLELDGLRVVHACWSATHLDHLRTLAGPGDTVTDLMLHRGNTRNTDTYDAVETVLKGPEVPLPTHLWYQDKEKVVRKQARYQWWSDGPMTLRHRAQSLPDMRDAAGNAHPGFDDTPITHPVPDTFTDGTPLIVGHYWLTGVRQVLSPTVACVDYSAGKGGPLVAYRWSGEPTLADANFTAIG